jgi:surface protein
MDEVIIYCPPTGTTITGECSTTESLIWQEESVNYIQFFVPFVNDQLIKFDLTNITNNGSNVELDLIYYVNGVYGSVKNVDLGVITSPISLYHFLDFGTTPGVYNYITLQFTISGGTTGQIDVTLDCDVDVVSQLFCSGATFTDACNCEQQITIYAEIIEDGIFPFQGSSWFLDASLQTQVPCGNYVPINPSNIPNSKYLNYYYNCSTNLPEIYGYCTSVCNEISCSGGTSTFTHIPQTYNNMNPLVETNLRTSKSEIVIEDKYNFSKVNRFSTHCVTIVFPQGSVGIYPITITYDGTDSREKYITFEDTAYFRTEDSPGQVSYSDEIPSNSPWFIPMNTDYLVNFKVNKTYYIIPPKSGRVTIKFSIGDSVNNIFVPPSSITTTITPSCIPTPIYKYNAGLHVYSAYDSIISPRCTTTVYSITPLGSWTKNSTVLFNDNWFVQPAFPYWYSVSGTTYKVGEQLKRDWGVIHQYKIRKKIASRAVNVTKQTSAYQNQMITDLFSGQRTLPSCVENVGMLGVIRDIVAQILVIQPTKYKYYVGVSDFPNTTIEANKITANDKYFNLIDAEFAGYSNDYCYPVTGFEFALVKLSLAYALFIPPYLDNFTAQRLQYENMTKLLQSRAVARSNFMTGLAMAIVATVMVGLSFGPKDGFQGPVTQGNSRYERGALKNYRDGVRRCPKWIARIPKVGYIIEQLYSAPKIAFSIEIAVALALVLLVQWLIPINRIVNECCRLLKVINTTNPYIFVGDYIFLNQNMTTPYQYGWLCDGAYYYKVIDGYVHEKQLSYTYRGVQYTPGGGIGLGTGPKIVSLLPDSPTYVADIPSLFFLPYVSGVPDGFTTNPLYQSQKISGVTLTDSSVTGALYDPLQNEYVLEEGFITSDISQQDADDRAVEFFDSVTANTQSMFGGLTYSPNTDYVSTIFTNEIKLEYNPRELLLFYDNTDLSGLTIGKTAYVDLGFSEALSGYYSLSSDTAYRKFYLILSGSVEDIYTMTTSASTSVTSYLSGNTINISQTDRDFTSGWYLKSDQPIFLPTLQNRWNSPEFYQSSEIVRGFLKTPSSADTFYIYSSNQGVASGYSEANESFYQEILTDAEMFQYYLPQTLLINQVQTCSLTGSGIDFQVTDISGNSTNSLYGVAFNAVIFTANTYDSTHSISIQSYETNKLLELPFEYNGQITDVQISGFTSQNPINKITFSAGTFTSCNTPSPTPTPTLTVTPTPTSSITPTPTFTPTPTSTPPPPFISLWSISGSNESITLPYYSANSAYDGVIDWGDGNQDTNSFANRTHTYTNPGTYEVKIYGTISGFTFGQYPGNNVSKDKIISVTQWGPLRLGRTSTFQFYQCTNLNLSGVTDVIDVSENIYLFRTFMFCSSLTSINRINEWNTSAMTNLQETFRYSNFNSNVSNWNVSNVVTLSRTFGETPFNQPIGNWNVSKANNMIGLFSFCGGFNQDLSSWNVSGVTRMDSMFNDTPFSSDISSWNVSNVTNMSSMFVNCDSFNAPIGSWNVSKVTNMYYMFGNNDLFNQDISSWNVSNVTNMGYMFNNATVFNQNIGNWNVSKVTNMFKMFESATAFNQDIGSWNISGVTNFADFMALKTDVDYSSSNLDSIYNGWSQLNVKTGITINFNTIKFTSSGLLGKQTLTGSPYNWIITDGGMIEATPTPTPTVTTTPTFTPTLTSSPTFTPTLTPSIAGLPTIYVSVCYDSVIPQDDFIVDFNFYTQSSGDSCGADQTLPLDSLSITFEAYPNDPYSSVGGIVTISGNSCVVASGEVIGDNITGFTITNISTPYSNNANYVVGTICSSGSCATCLSPTPTPTSSITSTPTPTVTETNTPTPTQTITSTPTETPTNTVTPTPTVTSGQIQIPTLNMVIAGVYSNVYELGIDLSINGGSTPDSAVLYFEWCTDSNAVGDATFNINASVTGSLQIPDINLSSTDTDTQFTGWGSYTYNVTTSSTSQLNALYVKTSTITYTTSDTTTRVVIDFVGVDNACSNQQSYVDYCVAKCDL